MVPFGNFGWNFGFGFGWILTGITFILMILGIAWLVLQIKRRPKKPGRSDHS